MDHESGIGLRTGVDQAKESLGIWGTQTKGDGGRCATAERGLGDKRSEDKRASQTHPDLKSAFGK